MNDEGKSFYLEIGNSVFIIGDFIMQKEMNNKYRTGIKKILTNSFKFSFVFIVGFVRC